MFIDDDDEERLETWLEEFIPEDEQERVAATIEDAVETKRPFDMEHEVFLADGTRGWTRSRAVPILDDDGDIIEWFGTATDITERKQRTRALEERTAELEVARTRLKVAAEAGSVGLYTVNVEEDRLVADRYVAECYGVDPDRAAEGAPVDEFVEAVHEDDTERVLREFETALTETGRLETEYRVRNVDGDLVWLLSRGTVEYDDAGNPHKLHGAISDISDQKRRERRDQFLVALDDTIRPLSDPVEIQREAARVLGEELGADRVQYGEVLDDENTNVVHADYHRDDMDSLAGEHQLDAYGEYIAEGFRAGETLAVDDVEVFPDLDADARQMCRQAQIRAWVGVPLVKDGGLDAYIAVNDADAREWTDTEVELVEETVQRTWDAVQRAMAEADLRENETKLSNILTQLPVGVGVLDADGTFELSNERLAELIDDDRMPSADSDQRDKWIVTDDDGDRLPPDQWPGARALRGEAVTSEIEFRPAENEEARWLNVSAVPFEEATAETKAIVVVQDVTERKRAERDLRESEARFRNVFENNMVPMGTWTTEGDIPDANDALLDLLGYTREELDAGELDWTELTPSEYHQLDQKKVREVEENGVCTPYEKEFIHKDGYRVPVVIGGGEFDTRRDRGILFAVDISERKAAERQRRESEERYRTLFDSIDEGFCIIEVLFDEDDDPADYRFLETNPAFEGQTGLTDAEGELMRDLEPNHEDHWFETYGRIARTGEPERFQDEAKYLGDRWYDVYAFRIGDPEENKVAILFDDVSELRHTQQALERLTVASQELIDADPETVRDRAAELVVDVLDVEYAALWQYDESSGDLSEAIRALDVESDTETIRHPDDVAEQVWQAFVGDEIAVSNDISADETVPDRATLWSRLLIPLGRHGVVCVGSLESNVFDERVIDLAETLGATLETAWDRAESEHRLQTQNEELQRLDRLNTLIREVDQALVGASTRAEIDEAVCERLANSDLYGSAWIATYDADTDSLRPQAWAGIDSRYLEAKEVVVGDASSDDPLVAAHRTDEMQVVPDVATDARMASWREDALEHGIRSCLSIPLVYEGSAYGILTVHGQTPRPDDRETEVLAEFGRTIAHAINALEAVTTGRTDSVVELTVRTRDANTPLARLSRETGCDISVEGLVPSATDDELLVFFTATDVTPDELAAVSDGILPIEDLTCLDDRADRSLFRARLTDPQLVPLLFEQDAVVRSMAIESGTITVIVDLPETAAVSDFLDELRQLFPDLELLARTTQTRPLETQSSLRMTVEGHLTARQLEVLQTAYESGYFESPRVQTGKDLSETLDISQSTFTYHLRESQRRLCELVFEPA